MTANYHTHTWRCRHAGGTEREYIEKAIEAGFTELGFSDHTPYPFPNGFCSGFRMTCEQADDYFRTLSDLKAEYKDQIKIHLGVEAEYYPKYFDDLIKFLEQYPCEYMIMGQHFIGNEIDDGAAYSGTDNESVFKRYAEQTLEGLNTGKFLYFAHPDLCFFSGNKELYNQYCRKMCEEILKLDIPLEINLLGIEGNRHYPNPEFWKIVGEVGNRVVLGCDAHSPDAVCVKPAIDIAMQIVEREHLKLETRLEIKDKI